jgi:hypothetical protein
MGELVPSREDEFFLMAAACERRGRSVAAIREEKERVLSRSARRSDFVGGPT